MRILPIVAVAAAMLYAPLSEARPASSGPYAEASLGATTFIGDANNNSKTGVSFGVRVGYELFSWLSVGANVGGSTHEATVPPPPEGEFFQLYHAAGDARLALKIRAFEIFAAGGGGVAMISTNILEKVGTLDPGERFAIVFDAGGGVEYQLQNRHYALGIAADWMMLPEFDAVQTITSRAYLRYTY